MRKFNLFLLYVAIGIWFAGWFQEVIYEKVSRRKTSDFNFVAKVNAAPPPSCECRVVDGKLVCTGCRRCPEKGGSGTIICTKASKPKPTPTPKPKPSPGLPPVIIANPSS